MLTIGPACRVYLLMYEISYIKIIIRKMTIQGYIVFSLACPIHHFSVRNSNEYACDDVRFGTQVVRSNRKKNKKRKTKNQIEKYGKNKNEILRLAFLLAHSLYAVLHFHIVLQIKCFFHCASAFDNAKVHISLFSNAL